MDVTTIVHRLFVYELVGGEVPFHSIPPSSVNCTLLKSSMLSYRTLLCLIVESVCSPHCFAVCLHCQLPLYDYLPFKINTFE